MIAMTFFHYLSILICTYSSKHVTVSFIMNCTRGYYDMFIRTCAKWPSNTAVWYYNEDKFEVYSYSELYGVCEYISQNLQQLQCTKGIIGLLSKPNIIIPCIIAAVHKCCTTFMFLDPTKDIDLVLNDIKLKVIISIACEIQLFNKEPDKSISIFNTKIDFYVLNDSNAKGTLYFNDHSFIATTSGSTGEPKHIQVPMQCIQPNIDDLTKIFQITQDDIIYFSTPLTFDPSMIEILLACTNGASLMIAPERAEILFPEGSNSITFWQTTPSKFFQFPDSAISNRILSSKSKLKVLALGGEPLTGLKQLKKLKAKDNTTKIYTLYGVTEMSCWACIAELNLEKHTNNDEIPLGTCLSETEVRIQPFQENKDLGNIILVSETRRCVNLKLNTEDSGSMETVDTGDLGEIKNGTVYYRGRRDDIIKRFGNKINLKSMEYIVMQNPDIKSCSCIWLPQPMLLIIYFSSEKISSDMLADILKKMLDDSMWPDKIIRVDNMPMNVNGKISKKLLHKLYENQLFNNINTADFKSLFLKELETTLNRNCILDEDINKDFFSMGGTSFLAVTLCNKLSFSYPEIGKILLPYLLSSKNSLNAIIKMAEVEYNNIKKISKIKRPHTSTQSYDLSKKKMSDCKLESQEYFAKNCLEINTHWTYDTGKCVDASPTVFQNGGTVYLSVGSHSGKLVTIDPVSGILKGETSLNSRIEASVFCFQNISGTACGVVGTYDGTVLCITLDNCMELWRINVGSMIKSKAICCNGLIYIASYDGKIRCINNKTGQIETTLNISNQAISADLVLSENGYLIVGTLSGQCVTINTNTNIVIWYENVNSPIFARPALYDCDKYVVFAEVSGQLHCRTVENGLQMWKYDNINGNIFSSLCIKETKNHNWQLTFGCHDNKIYSIEINNNQPNLQWTSELNSPVYSTPCILKNFILAFSTKGQLVILNTENGSIVHEHMFPGEVFSSPTIFMDYIFIGCRNDHLYALKYKFNVNFH